MTYDALNQEEHLAFFRNYAKFCALFGEEEVKARVLMIPFDQLVEVQLQHGNSFLREPWQKPHRFIKEERRTVEVRHPIDSSYTKHEQRSCRVYIVPDRYQGLKHALVVRPILLQRMPWLSEFKFDVYELHFYPDREDNEEFYVNVEKGFRGHHSLYVPYRAFLARDAQAIIKRNEEYLRWYTNSDEVWNAMKEQPKVKRFFELLGSPELAQEAA